MGLALLIIAVVGLTIVTKSFAQTVVTIEPGEEQALVYVIYHTPLVSGSCSAAPAVQFLIDAGAGMFLNTSNGGTMNSNRNVVNNIAPIAVAGECQAWVRLSSGLLGVVDVLTFTGPNNDFFADSIIDFTTINNPNSRSFPGFDMTVEPGQTDQFKYFVFHAKKSANGTCSETPVVDFLVDSRNGSIILSQGGPGMCNNNATCDVGENQVSCQADCGGTRELATSVPMYIQSDIYSLSNQTFPLSAKVGGPYSIGGQKFNDLNNNGIKDGNELGLPNWTIDLSGVTTSSTTTDANGNYNFISNEECQAWVKVSNSLLGITSIVAIAHDATNATVAELWRIADYADPNNSGSAAYIRTSPSPIYNINELQQSGWNQISPSGGGYALSFSGAQDATGKDFGNIQSISDSTPPTVSITSPTTDDFLTSSQVVTGTASDDVGVTGVTVNGIPATSSDNFAHWTATITGLTVPTLATPAALTFTATASDASGKTGTASVKVDNDGIDAVIDTNANNYTNDFTDGTTSGQVINRFGWTLRISDITTPVARPLTGWPNTYETGVQAKITGTGTANATINTCTPPETSAETVLLKANNDTGNITCVTAYSLTLPNSSTLLYAEQAATSLRVYKDATGTNVTTHSVPGFRGSPVGAGLGIGTGNTWDLTKNNTPVGGGLLHPGDVYDVTVIGSEEDPTGVTVTNLFNTSGDITVDENTVTLQPGQSYTDECLGVRGLPINHGCPASIKGNVILQKVWKAGIPTIRTTAPATIKIFNKDIKNIPAANRYADTYLNETASLVGTCSGNTTCGLTRGGNYYTIAQYINPAGFPVYDMKQVKFDTNGTGTADLLFINTYDKNGVFLQSDGTNLKQLFGSLLNMYEPAEVVVADTTAYATFVYETPDHYWDILASYVPPTGCTVDQTEQSVHVDQSMGGCSLHSQL
jgi:hypothetical protein